MLHDIKCDDVKVQKAIRLGKRPTDVTSDGITKPRPLKLVLENEQQKLKILRSAKNLHRSQEGAMKAIFIHQDLTMKERQIRRQLVKELNDRRNQGEEDLIIVNNQIVKRWSSLVNRGTN